MNDTAAPGPDQPAAETRPLGAQAAAQQTLDPGPSPAPPEPGRPDAYGAPQPGHPPYDGGPVAGYPGSATPPGYPGGPRPRFRDQVLGMRAVIAVALVALVLGGLGGALLGAWTSGGDGDRFGGGPGGQHGSPGQMPGQGQLPGQGQMPNQQFQQTPP